MVQGDRKRLVQVFTSVLNNAAKYTSPGGHILLRTRVDDAHAFIEVSDNGIGLTPELVSRAFDLFAQAERSSDRSSGGLGPGLALVKSLTELHHGWVRCESAGVGHGSTFTICLPRLSMQKDLDGGQIDGYELARQLRARPETANAVLIAITGYGQENDREQSRAAGFDHHLVKPVDTTVLASILSTIARD